VVSSTKLAAPAPELASAAEEAGLGDRVANRKGWRRRRRSEQPRAREEEEEEGGCLRGEDEWPPNTGVSGGFAVGQASFARRRKKMK
jgi:hypothetical protein